MIWNTAVEFLELFSVRVSAGADWFTGLVELLALYKCYPEFGIGKREITRHELRRLRVSPMIYWANMRRALRPLMDADPNTLRALGLVLPDDFNCSQLADAVAAVLAANAPQNREYAAELAPLFT